MPRVETVALTSYSRWSVYVLRCGDGSLYTGIATDVARRVAEHENGPRGSKYLRGRAPLSIVLQMELGDRAVATRAEVRIKRLARREKERLIRNPERLLALLGTS
jgi:putative endonuclease